MIRFIIYIITVNIIKTVNIYYIYWKVNSIKYTNAYNIEKNNNTVNCIIKSLQYSS